MIEKIEVSAFTVPTDFPEEDGTYAWNSTTLVVVEAFAPGGRGLGYTYADEAAARLIETKLSEQVVGLDPMDVPRAWDAMMRSIRNLGRPGLCATAISAVDSALWDLKARMLGVPLASLLGAVRDAVPVYGSGGFTSYPIDRLTRQLGDWVSAGIDRVKMKIGAHPEEDLARVKAVRAAIGPDAGLFVDANGAYGRKHALAKAEQLAALKVSWFEEPVSSDDLAPAVMNIAAGEYGYDTFYFRRMLEAGAVDVLQADATRCGGITGFMRAGALAEAFGIPLSAHCAPALHTHPGCAISGLVHIEYFHDHVRIEQMFFEGATTRQRNGFLQPDLSRPGLGLGFKKHDATKFQL
jgi:L-alanine-DL-glutamate epimerase-like enolase superfamily enzyme